MKHGPRLPLLRSLLLLAACGPDSPADAPTGADSSGTTTDTPMSTSGDTVDDSSGDDPSTTLESSSTSDEPLPPPVAVDDVVEIHEELGWEDTATLWDNDMLAGESVSFTERATTSTNGHEITLRSDGRFGWYGEDGSLGADSFEYAIQRTGDMIASEPATVALTVTPTTYDLEDLRASGTSVEIALPGVETAAVYSLGDLDDDGLDDFALARDFRRQVVFGTARGFPESADIDAGIAGFELSNGSGFMPVGDFDGIPGDEVGTTSAGGVLTVIRSGAPGTIVDLELEPDLVVARYDASAAGVTEIRPAADVNGDGIGDLVISYQQYPLANGGQGLVAVLFGSATPVDVTIADLMAGIGGFTIAAGVNEELFGRKIAVADVNGDGLTDIVGAAIVGATRRAWVVFGETSPTSFDLDAIGSRGFVIDFDGADQWSMSGIGDFDGDGLEDLAFGDGGFAADPKKDEQTGAVFLVWGKADSDAVDLGSLAADGDGRVILGAGPGLYDASFGTDMVALGDLDGDGRDDFGVYASGGDRANPSAGDVGRTMVIYGRPRTDTIDLATLLRGEGGFVLVGGRGEKAAFDARSCLRRSGRCDLLRLHREGYYAFSIEVIATAGL